MRNIVNSNFNTGACFVIAPIEMQLPYLAVVLVAKPPRHAVL